MLERRKVQAPAFQQRPARRLSTKISAKVPKGPNDQTRCRCHDFMASPEYCGGLFQDIVLKTHPHAISELHNYISDLTIVPRECWLAGPSRHSNGLRVTRHKMMKRRILAGRDGSQVRSEHMDSPEKRRKGQPERDASEHVSESVAIIITRAERMSGN